MIINNPEALKGWLSEVLAPLCEAEPIALARYVFALLKKDKPVKDLKKSMTEQLDVFLGAETKPFLDRLFSAISSEEYLTQTPAMTNIVMDIQMPDNIETTFELKHEKECTPPLLYENKTKEIIKSAEVMSNISSDETQTPIAGTDSPVEALQSSPTKTSDKENQPREPRRRRVSLRSRSRSRSRSGERSRRSRSRDRRVGEKRVFRNKSPPPTTERRRIERRGTDRDARAIGKNRTKSNSASRSRSCSPEPRKISRSSSPPPATENNNVNNNKRQRCRDFDEKGYCVRGETCPWDHGINPVVLEGINNPTLIAMPSHLREYNPDAPELWNRSSAFPGPRGAFPHKSGVVPGNYNRPPGAGFRPTGGAFPFPINPAATPLQRELISVPVVDANAGGDVSATQSKRRYEPEDTVAIAEGSAKRKIPINSRLGPRVGPQQNCTLELRKIPRGMNTITHLNNHFSKFGKIINIQISYEGDPEAATVAFSTHAEANVAYRSTEAVLNNRFIKVFWHSPGSTENPAISSKDDILVNGRKPSQYHLNNVIPALPTTAAEGAKITNAVTSTAANNSTNTAPTTTSSSSASMVSSPGPIRLKTNRQMNIPTNAIIRKKQEDHIKTAVQLAHGLHKRKHELLREYLKEMKAAVELVSRAEPSDPARATKLTTIKDLEEIIDKLRKEIATEQMQLSAQIQNQPPVKKTKEQQKKELLDLELELIAQQQEGNDTTAIQKRLEDLQRSLGISSSSSAPHKPHFNRNMRVRSTVSTCVDRRPTTLLISGFDSEDSDLLLGHFKHFGEITKHELDRSAPQLSISYATRSNAEQALLRGRVFKEKRLQIAWAPTQNKIEHLPADPTINKKAANETVPDSRLEDEEEEEDAESEDRSWRR